MMLPQMIPSIHLATQPVDMRKSIDGLSALVADQLELNPLSGQLFIFYNRGRDKIKVLYWDKNGFCLWYKRLERQRFHIPEKLPSDTLTISNDQLSWLLSGLHFHQMKGHETLTFSKVN